ncbi:MAG: hypothetical protein RIE86_16705 [Imperialibacter sp.]|uniref:hypothetical protein n=1 Tax=Imperialibacter sp. TaxID=2038411 RepID=UPI0032EFEC77
MPIKVSCTILLFEISIAERENRRQFAGFQTRFTEFLHRPYLSISRNGYPPGRAYETGDCIADIQW